jgi:bis(5'-nucleosyl)-tetraphosphatase (symmetrical)
MATYAIGDVQGCYDELRELLDRIGFEPARDCLWFVGDLVNRGPKSLDVLRFVRQLGERALTVLGNHDLHLIAQHEGFERRRKDDTFDDVLNARDARELVYWLRTRRMMHAEGRYAKALSVGKEVESALSAPNYREFVANMYGSTPAAWSDGLTGWDRLRVIVNAMTRMRFCTRDGRMEFQAKGVDPPPGYLPWYAARPDEEETILCGHWSALGLKLTDRLAALDSGCVWGGRLTALRLEDRALYQVPCLGYQSAGGEG